MRNLLGPPYTDVRVEVPEITLGQLGREFPNSLHSINMRPPASGPEIELVFGTPVGGEYCTADVLRTTVERSLGCTVLAMRTRDEGFTVRHNIERLRGPGKNSDERHPRAGLILAAVGLTLILTALLLNAMFGGC